MELASSSAKVCSYLFTHMNVQYDQQHHALLDRVEQSLRLVEQREADRRTKKPAVSTTSSSAKVGTVAIRKKNMVRLLRWTVVENEKY